MATVANFATVQKEADRQVQREEDKSQVEKDFEIYFKELEKLQP